MSLNSVRAKSASDQGNANSGWDSEYVLKIKPTGCLGGRAYGVW